MATKSNGLTRIFGGLLVGVICLGISFCSNTLQAIFLVLLSLLTVVELSNFSASTSTSRRLAYLLVFLFTWLPFIPGIPQIGLLIVCCIILVGFVILLLTQTFRYTPNIILFIGCIYPCLALGVFAMTVLHTSIQYLLLLFFALIWTSDVGAYYVGKTFGKRKLMPKISPGKTVAGFIGAGVSVVIISFILNLYFQYFGPIQSIVLGIIIWFFSSLGDLFQSSLKRYAGIKDSGNIIPGHGGVFDRFDGFIFAAPFYSIFLILI